MHKDEYIMTINGGSSSIKFSLYKIEDPLKQIFNGQIQNFGFAKAKLSSINAITQQINNISIKAANHDEAVASTVVVAINASMLKTKYYSIKNK